MNEEVNPFKPLRGLLGKRAWLEDLLLDLSPELLRDEGQSLIASLLQALLELACVEQPQKTREPIEQTKELLFKRWKEMGLVTEDMLKVPLVE